MNAIAYMLHFRLFLLHMLPTHSHWPTFVDYCPGTLNVLSDSLLNIQENERNKNFFLVVFNKNGHSDISSKKMLFFLSK